MRVPFAAAAAALVCALSFAAPGRPQDDDRRFSITPYFWLPTVEGDFRFNIPDRSPDVSVGPIDYLENLEGALMLAGDARFDRISVFTDFIYLDFGRSDAWVRTINGPGPIQIPIDTGSEIDFSGLLWTLAAGYDVVDNERIRVQPFVGMRYLGVDADLEWRLAGPLDLFPQNGSVSRDADVTDGLVGVRGEGRAGRWIFPYYADVGGGSSELTWQGSFGAGYRFGWGDLWLDYRYLSYEQDEAKLIQDLSFGGPSAGATFRF